MFQYTPNLSTSYVDSIWNYTSGGYYQIEIGPNYEYASGLNERSLGAQVGTENNDYSSGDIDVFGALGSLAYFENQYGDMHTGWNNPDPGSGDEGWHFSDGAPSSYGYASWVTVNQSAYAGSQNGC